jgi:hypothetical protein
MTGRACSTYWRADGNYGKETEGGRALGKSRCRWKDNIELDIEEAG